MKPLLDFRHIRRDMGRKPKSFTGMGLGCMLSQSLTIDSVRGDGCSCIAENVKDVNELQLVIVKLSTLFGQL
ncbi:hypothetical protein L1887_18042 [Cichorium endivia]|nr:hypothetical protein L1887_18042 [Cichorium endivia]